MDRRTLIAAAPFLALPGPGPRPGRPPTQCRPRTPPPPPNFPPPTLAMTTLAKGLHFPEAPVVMKDGSVLFVQTSRPSRSAG